MCGGLEGISKYFDGVGDCGACQEKCNNQSKTWGMQGCCECRTNGYCKFYGKGYINFAGYDDAKAVLCPEGGKIIHSFYNIYIYIYNNKTDV